MKWSLKTSAWAVFATVVSQGLATKQAFDGPYVSHPSPGPGNDAVEWWWFQSIAPEVNGTLPSFEAVFYSGFIFARDSSAPNWRLDLSGVFPNGTGFFVSRGIEAPPVIKTKGEAVSGDWAGYGRFDLSADRRHLDLTINDPEHGIVGNVHMVNAGTPPHVGCSADIFKPPYFTELAHGRNLSKSETLLYERTGWAVAAPRTVANIDLNVNGSKLVLKNAVGYHDHNWMPTTVDKFVYTWVLGIGSCGPFDLTYVEVQALGSSRNDDILTASLAYKGKYIQETCLLYKASRQRSTVEIEFTGQTVDPVTGDKIPTGAVVDFVLANGTRYHFELENNVLLPSRTVYKRWRMGGSGGMVGGKQHECLVIGDWLNPGRAPYTEGTNIFDKSANDI